MSEEFKKNKSDVWEDPRFSKLVGDPRFRNLSAASRKVKVDKRFESMFSNEKFGAKCTIDKYGRPINQVKADDLKKYYEISSSESDEDEAEKELAALKAEDRNDELATDGESLSNTIREKLLESRTDFARGEGRILSDSSSDDESSDDDEIIMEHVWGELDADAPETNEVTYRLAACNMDWDKMRASDIMVLCNSFLPPGGNILSVKIYVSEYGKERLKQEDILGPIEMRETLEKNNTIEPDLEGNDTDDDADEYEMEKLRQYQLNRLKYYYAVIECDSKETADKLYTECDGLEYESTATKFDLRFIPDDEKFYEEEIKDKCTQLPDLAKYQPRLFTTTALQQAKVELTWDETSTERRELSKKLVSGKYDEVNDQDLKTLICCTSSEENDSSDDASEKPFCSEIKKQNENEKKTDQLSKYKSLLEEINQKETVKNKNKCEMEYSWGMNIKSDKSNDKKDTNKNLTVIEKILNKKKESKKRRKQIRNDDDNSSDDLPDGINLDDPYFAEEFVGNDFEPVNNQQTSKKKRKVNDATEETNELSSKELELLVDDDDNQHFSLKKILKSEKGKKKPFKKSKKEIEKLKNQEKIEDFQIDIQDERFKDVYVSHLYNIDPSNPHFKNTKGMQTIINEKMKRFTDEGKNNVPSRSTKSKEELENSILIKNLKRKIKK